MALKNLEEILSLSKLKKKLAVVTAEDENVLLSVKTAYNKKIIVPILIGDRAKIEKIATSIEFEISDIEIIDNNNPVEASQIAVDLVKLNQAEIIMKGLLSTAALLKIIVKHENKLVTNNLLSHFAISQLPSYHKLLAFTDAAINIKPNLESKITLIRNAVHALNQLGYSKPKVAILCPVEVVNTKIESTVHAAKLKEMNLANQITNCVIDGPLALDNAISITAARHKNIFSEVAGDADLLVVDNLDAGNILYKSINFLAGGTTAAIVVGGKVPIVLTSRADDEATKLYSIALATYM